MTSHPTTHPPPPFATVDPLAGEPSRARPRVQPFSEAELLQRSLLSRLNQRFYVLAERFAEQAPCLPGFYTSTLVAGWQELLERWRAFYAQRHDGVSLGAAEPFTPEMVRDIDAFRRRLLAFELALGAAMRADGPRAARARWRSALVGAWRAVERIADLLALLRSPGRFDPVDGDPSSPLF